MVKITPDNIGAKIGKVSFYFQYVNLQRVDIKNATELNISKLQIDDLGSFQRMENLEKVDLR